MSRVVSRMPEDDRRYPWDEWLDGQVRLLVPGEDFRVTPRSMGVQFRAAARKRGLSAVTRARPEGLYVHAFDAQELRRRKP